jgi:hypothetical protein
VEHLFRLSIRACPGNASCTCVPSGAGVLEGVQRDVAFSVLKEKAPSCTAGDTSTVKVRSHFDSMCLLEHQQVLFCARTYCIALLIAARHPCKRCGGHASLPRTLARAYVHWHTPATDCYRLAGPRLASHSGGSQEVAASSQQRSRLASCVCRRPTGPGLLVCIERPCY